MISELTTMEWNLFLAHYKMLIKYFIRILKCNPKRIQQSAMSHQVLLISILLPGCGFYNSLLFGKTET